MCRIIMAHDDFNELFNTYRNDIEDNGKPVKKDGDSPAKKITQSLSNRETYYSKMTKNYVNQNLSRFILKEIHKWVFFWVMMGALIAVSVLFVLIAVKVIELPVTEITDAFPLLLGAFASFIATIIAIPLLIGQYLFNKSEDNNMGQMVLNMQQYDREGQALFSEYIFHEKNEK